MKRAREEGKDDTDVKVNPEKLELKALRDLYGMLQQNLKGRRAHQSMHEVADGQKELEVEVAMCPVNQVTIVSSLRHGGSDNDAIVTACHVVVLLARHAAARRVLVQACQSSLVPVLAALVHGHATRPPSVTREVLLALSGLVSGNHGLQKTVCTAFPVVLDTAVALLLACDSIDGLRCSCAWLLYHLVRDAPDIQDAFAGSLGILDVLLHVLGRADVSMSARCLVAWALQATIARNKRLQQQAYDKHVVAVAFKFLSDANACSNAAEQISGAASAIWIFGTLANEMVDIQNELGLCLDMFRCLVGQLMCVTNETHIHFQACLTVHALALGNPGNQRLLGKMGCVEALFKVLDAPWRSSATLDTVIVHTATEKVLSAILCLVVQNPENQERVAAQPRHLQLLVQLLGSPASKIRGVAAIMLRMALSGLVSEKTRASVFLQVMELGALKGFICMVARSPNAALHYGVFAQEQACAALYNFVHNPLAEETFADPKNRADVLQACIKLVASSALVSCKQGGSSVLALTSAVMTVLVILNSSVGDAHAETLTCARNALFMQALRNYASDTCPDEVLSAHAWSLLQKICPDDDEEREEDEFLSICHLAIQSLATVKRTGRVASDATETCVICMEEVGGDSALDGKDEVYSPCFHSFHRICIHKWICIKDECPKCRQSVLKNIQKLKLGM